MVLLLRDTTRYRHLVGSLVYLTVTRPDIAHAVHIVSQFVSAPTSQDSAVKQACFDQASKLEHLSLSDIKAFIQFNHSMGIRS